MQQTNTSPVRLAIAGCGAITDESHLPAALGSPHAEVKALIDSSPDRAARLARKYGCDAEIGERLEAVLGKVEGVLIATPNHTHSLLARIALEQGVPVLVEKPLTTTYADAIELCELAKRNGTFISVGFVTRHFPVVRLMKRLLGEGFFGRLDRFCFEFGTAGGWAPVSGYNLDRNQSGGGVLVVNGTHYLDRMLYWFGWPERFTFADDSFGGVEANCRATFEYAGGFEGSMFLSKSMSLKNRFTIEAERFHVEVSLSEVDNLTLFPKDLPGTRMSLCSTDRPAAADPFLAQIEDFASVIRKGGSPAVDGEFGALSVKLCEQLYACRTQLEEPWAWYRKAAKVQA
ncbi:MAG: Gfo/Idh/MocA family oxidoreductase [Acidobacteria bacterium]|nr:Gfo/Idh/MocA family oxidoreductase [Acidobacteriota bacterium]